MTVICEDSLNRSTAILELSKVVCIKLIQTPPPSSCLTLNRSYATSGKLATPSTTNLKLYKT